VRITTNIRVVQRHKNLSRVRAVLATTAVAPKLREDILC